MVFKLNEDGFLIGISTELRYDNERPRRKKIHGAPSTILNGKTLMVNIERRTWIDSTQLTMRKINGYMGIVGITFDLLPQESVSVGSAEGAKRIFAVSMDHFFVGFLGETARGVVTRLGLIEGQLEDELDHLQVFSPQIGTGTSLQSCVWTDSIPPRQLVAHDVRMIRELGLALMQTLITGTTREDLEALTGIRVDVMMRGFSAHYSNQPNRSLGLRYDAQKHFAISGARGERLIGMQVAHHRERPNAICFQTKWSRQFVLGQLPKRGGWQLGKRPDVVLEPGNDFVGIHCSSSQGRNTEELATCSMLSGPVDGENLSRFTVKDWARDQAGRI